MAPNQATGNLAVAGQQGYRNGVAEGAVMFSGGPWTQDIYIGGRNGGGVFGAPLHGEVVAFAAYSCTLTAPEVLTVETAMAAL